jgi:hypothetical protein
MRDRRPAALQERRTSCRPLSARCLERMCACGAARGASRALSRGSRRFRSAGPQAPSGRGAARKSGMPSSFGAPSWRQFISPLAYRPNGARSATATHAVTPPQARLVWIEPCDSRLPCLRKRKSPLTSSRFRRSSRAQAWRVGICGVHRGGASVPLAARCGLNSARARCSSRLRSGTAARLIPSAGRARAAWAPSR